jgi:uncharacterized protein (TIGR03546 family)
MIILFKQLFALLKILNSETGENQIAAGISLGLILGFAPFLSLQTLLVILIILIFRVQAGAAFGSAFFFAFIAWIVDPLADVMGRHILENMTLRPLFATLYNMPIVPLTRFNDSIVMGSLAISIVLSVPGFYFFRWAIRRYRNLFLSRIRTTRWWKFMQATTLYKWYAKYEALYG